jgi:CheY-like chemotaxis protein
VTKEALILFLEETEGEARRYASRLARYGFSTVVVSKAEDMLGVLLGPTPPAAIVIERENQDWQLTRLLRADPRTCRVPIVALVRDGASPVVASETGCERVLPKPCSPAELAVAIETLLLPASRLTTRPRALSSGLQGPAAPTNGRSPLVDDGQRAHVRAVPIDDGSSVRLMHLRIAVHSGLMSLEATSQVNAAPAGASDFPPTWHQIAKKAATRLRAARELAGDLPSPSEREPYPLKAMRAALARIEEAFDGFEGSPEGSTRMAAIALGRVVAEVKADSEAWE